MANWFQKLIKRVKRPPTNEKTKTPAKEEKNPDKLDVLVSRLLENKSVNSKYVPDYIEHSLYRNMLELISGLTEEFLLNTKIEFLDGKIGFTLERPEDSSSQA